MTFTLFYLTEKIPIAFRVDKVALIFAAVALVVYIAALFYTFRYMKAGKGYYLFYTLTLAALLGLYFAENLVTMYLFYELVTLMSFPLVIHDRTRESIMAAMKYLLYSLCGAYMGLFGIYVLSQNTKSLSFVAGGNLDLAKASGNTTLLLVAALFVILGFGVKAGMFPMHAWLPTAHPVAPSPASAFLSGIIVKAGVLALIRVIFYSFGPDFLRGTWVQYVWMILSLTTVFMGSMLAYREKIFKKRLAYSTVSQISYIVFGLSCFSPAAFTGSLLHVVFHAFIKSALFLYAGAVIHQTGKTRVEDYRGIGKSMPISTWCYLIVSLALVGIPPLSGFISKWYLASGSLSAGIGAYGYVGVAVLLVSALLTAGYLLPIAVKGFLPGEAYSQNTIRKKEPSAFMWIPILILTILTVILGCFPGLLIQYIETIASAVF